MQAIFDAPRARRAGVLLLVFAVLSFPGLVLGQGAGTPNYATDNDRFDGDRLRLMTDVDGFKPVQGTDDERKKSYCAPKGSIHMAPFEHEHFLAGTRQVGGVHQPVVSAADHDDIVGVRH